MMQLPVPKRGGDLVGLRNFVNAVDDDWILFLAFLVGVWAPNPPYPVYNITGEQGSAKSTRARAIRALTDPNASPIGRTPKDDRDFAIAANSEWVVTFDNVSKLPPAMSDNIARLSTGSGARTRTLYTDTEQTILDAARPVVINGIADSITQDDLADRAITVSIPRIPPTKRRAQIEFDENFKQHEPLFVGALCDAVSHGLKMLPSTMLSEPPRMADFAHWVAACSGKLGFSTEQFLFAYSINRNASHEATLESSPIGPVLIAALEDDELFGTPMEILEKLHPRLSERERRSKQWPSSGRAFTNELKRITPSLRASGIDVERLEHRKSNRGVPYRIGPERNQPESSVTSITPPVPVHNSDESTNGDEQPHTDAEVRTEIVDLPIQSEHGDSSDSAVVFPATTAPESAGEDLRPPDSSDRDIEEWHDRHEHG
jgi:hypothetical protein